MAKDKYTLVMRILDDQNRLTDRADTKAISLLTALGLFTVLFISQLNAITIVVPFTIVLLVIYCVSVIMAVLHIILAISPRIRTAKKTGAAAASAVSTPQPTFFGGICQFPDSVAYGKTLDELCQVDENVNDTYTRQIYEVAQINRTKYKFVGRAVWFVVVTLISQIALIIFLFSQRISHLPN
ncbi:MAG TPA: Pycsar system effector family protein [Dehalococcoidales bacterium]|nr:Pycsar system effector family protein [Dehalococcoidales bacterium]